MLRHTSSLATVSVVVVTGLIMSSARASESLPQPDQPAAARAVMKAAGAAYVGPERAADGTWTADVGPSTVEFPANGSGEVTVDGVGIGLPGGSELPAVETPDGSLVYGSTEAPSETVVQTTPEGVRLLVVLKNSSASRQYRFPVDLPTGARLHETADGSVLLAHPKRGLLANIDAPWAKDAVGAPVPTEYRVNGAAIVQDVRPRPSTVYPVVADPLWVPIFILLARIILANGIKSFSRHATTQMARRHISREVVESVVKNGRRSAGNTKDTVKFTKGKVWVIVNKQGNVVSVGRN